MESVPSSTLRPPTGAIPRGSVPFPGNGDVAAITEFAERLADVAAGLAGAERLLRAVRSHADATWDGPAADSFDAHVGERLTHLDGAMRATAASVDPIRQLAAAVGASTRWYAHHAELEIGLAHVTDPRADLLRRDAVWQQMSAVRQSNEAGEQVAALLRPNIDQIAAATRGMEPGRDSAASAAAAGERSVEELLDYLLGDLLSLWNGGPDREHLPLGKIGAALSKLFRIGSYWPSGFDPRTFPTWNTGAMAGWTARQLGRFEATAAAGTWLSTPAKATPWFRGAGIAGGVVSPGVGAYDLIQQGNPIDAYRARGAGYVADVASTAFSASTTAFLIAPNPVTGALAIGTGVVWVGAEVVDHWDEIVDVADTVTGAVGDTIDGAVDSVRETTGEMIDQTFGEWVRRTRRRSQPDGAWF